MKQILFINTLITVLVLLSASTAFGQSSGGTYALTNSVIASGGGRSDDGGGGYTLTGIAGQPVAAPRSDGGAYAVRHGFWSELSGATAASVSVSGRITTPVGRGIKGVLVTAIGGDMKNPFTALTNARGQFRFEELEIGQIYIITVERKGYVFAPPQIVISPNSSQTDVDFQGFIEQ